MTHVELPGDTSATEAMKANTIKSAGTPVLFDTVRASGPEGIRFDEWYANEHLAALAAAPGVRRLRRYAVPSRSSYFVAAEWDATAGFQSPPFTIEPPASAAHFERFVGRPIGSQRRRDVGEDAADAAVAYPVFFAVPEGDHGPFNRWYDEEHIEMLLACPHWVGCRRFAVDASPGVGWTHVALHYLTDLSSLRSKERDAARCTPWRRRLEEQPWFKAEYRVCYHLQDFVGSKSRDTR